MTSGQVRIISKDLGEVKVVCINVVSGVSSIYCCTCSLI